MKFATLFFLQVTLLNVVFGENLANIKSDKTSGANGGANPLSGDFLTGFESGIFLR
jgi:hypothetical protein